VRAEPDVEAVEPEPANRALRRIGGPQRRLGKPLVEILHDHERLRKDEAAVLFEHRYRPARVLCVEPTRTVREVDLDRLVAETLLRKDDPRPGTVGAAGCVVEDHAAESSRRGHKYGCVPGGPQTRCMPLSSVGHIPMGMRPPCVLGLFGLRTTRHERTYGRAD